MCRKVPYLGFQGSGGEIYVYFLFHSGSQSEDLRDSLLGQITMVACLKPFLHHPRYKNGYFNDAYLLCKATNNELFKRTWTTLVRNCGIYLYATYLLICTTCIIYYTFWYGTVALSTRFHFASWPSCRALCGLLTCRQAAGECYCHRFNGRRWQCRFE